jgi:hypothetical protein
MLRSIIVDPMPAGNYELELTVDGGQPLPASSRARKILIVLDACFSGKAVGELIRRISLERPGHGRARLGSRNAASPDGDSPMCEETRCDSPMHA